MYWLVLDVNPEPWAVGPVGLHRAGGKMGAHIGRNQQLAAYQEAVREAAENYLSERGIDLENVLIEGPVEMNMFFWRRRDSYTTTKGKKVTKSHVDLTNMQKATEDALAGLFYKNDSAVVHIDAYVVDQGPDVVPCLALAIGAWKGSAVSHLPEAVLSEALTLQMHGEVEQLKLSDGKEYDTELF